MRRPALVSPSGGEAATAKQKDAGKKASGLSPYMLELNKHLANTKKALGRKMTLDEVTEARVNFRRLYGNLEDKSSFEDAYAEWKQCGTEPVKGAIQVYESSWGSGSRATPVAPEEFHAHIRECGWPEVTAAQNPPPASPPGTPPNIVSYPRRSAF